MAEMLIVKGADVNAKDNVSLGGLVCLVGYERIVVVADID